MKKKKGSPEAWVLGGVLVAAVIAVGIYYGRQDEAPAPSTPAGAEAPPAEAEPAIRHPIAPAQDDQASDAAEVLPALADSDAALREALAALLGEDGLLALLNPERIVERVVATVDNLPRQRIVRRILPVKPVPGTFEVAEAEGRLVLSEANHARYAPYMRAAQAVDAEALVALYVRFYPLFQQAYQDLGYPTGYFNDRLVEVIDHLLAARDAPAPIELARGKDGLYEYAEPALEARSIGHKALLRMGPDNAAKVKDKLREVRDALTKRSPGA